MAKLSLVREVVGSLGLDWTGNLHISALQLAHRIKQNHRSRGVIMDEKDLIKLWNTMRSQIITAQFAPTILLIGVFTLAAFGKFEAASDQVKYLVIGVAAATGILAIISQYATIREAESLIVDLKKLNKTSELAKKISESGQLLTLSAVAVVGLGVAVFAVVTWAVFG